MEKLAKHSGTSEEQKHSVVQLSSAAYQLPPFSIALLPIHLDLPFLTVHHLSQATGRYFPQRIGCPPQIRRQLSQLHRCRFQIWAYRRQRQLDQNLSCSS